VSIIKLIIFILISQAAGFLGSIFTIPSIPTWYAGLKKPAFSPPNWLFGPVWLALFTLMGIASFLIWNKGVGKGEVRIALILFLGQLILNVLWSYFFFNLHNPLFALVEIIILWLAILATIISFYRLSQPAGIILIPYLLWVSFAAILNFAIFRLNR